VTETTPAVTTAIGDYVGLLVALDVPPVAALGRLTTLVYQTTDAPTWASEQHTCRVTNVDANLALFLADLHRCRRSSRLSSPVFRPR
jgi:hypothetical protein